MYRERASVLAGAGLAGATVWQHVDVPAGEHRVLPDGCVDLIWLDGDLLVAGPDTVAHVGGVRAGSSFTGLRLPPGVGPAVLGLPAREIRDLRVPLADLWPAAPVRRLAGQVGTAARPGLALERIAADRLDRAGRPGRTGSAARVRWPDGETAVIAAQLRAGATVAKVAAEVGWGERRLHRHCLASFGYGAKTLARILRMTRALDAARTGQPLAEVAAGTGYADQAHLTREVRALAGVPPTVLLGFDPL
jgi:AraC-like DNA-binding protein